MNWKITVDKENQYVEVSTTGIADTEDTRKMAMAIAEKCQNLKITRVLIDHSHLEGVGGSVPDIYMRPKEFFKIGVPVTMRIAAIIKAEHKEHFNFLELVLMNQGYDYVLFKEKGTALEWLISEVFV
jgi:hypothetical protein